MKTIHKTLIALIALILGLSQEVAAQYGVTSCHYKLNGEVRTGECSLAIPGISVKLNRPADTSTLGTVFTDEDGKYTIEFSSTSFPGNMDSLQLSFEDIDGDENYGSFKQIIVPVDQKKDAWKQTESTAWDVDWVCVSPLLVAIKPEESDPCTDIRK